MAHETTQTVLITGASGLVGSHLQPLLEHSGYRVLRAVRREVQDGEHEIRWDPEGGNLDRGGLAPVDAVVHLAGANIAGRRWTSKYKRTIRDSRVKGTRLLADAVAQMETKPRVFACASAIGYYGDRGDAELTESAAPGEGFLADVCREWEDACQAARDAGIRTVNFRLGMVLSREGGALATMLPPFKLGAGGVVGSGKQHMSWIELHDAVRAIQTLLENESLQGPVNLVTPQPVTNREFTKTLGRVLRRPTVMPLPALAARLALGEMADGLLLASARVVPERLEEAGFRFDHPELEQALRHALQS